MTGTTQNLASISTPILILVEGTTDKEFIETHLLSLNGLKEHKANFTVYAAGSYEKISHYLRGVKDIRGFSKLRILAVIADSDEEPQLRREEIESGCNALVNESLQARILLIPSDTESGALESLVLQTLAKEQLACADDYVQCIGASLNTAQRDKLKLYAWISQHQKEPVTNFMRVKHHGHRVIDSGHEAFKPVVDFLQDLLAQCLPKY